MNAPRWADVGGYSLYFYGRENHRRPHVAVMRGTRRIATIDIATGEVLAGAVPPADLRRIRALLERHRGEAKAAFEAMLRHELPPRLDSDDEGGDES